MKVLLCLMLMFFSVFSYSQKVNNLESMSEKKRTAYLVKHATKVVKEYGPDYYRNFKPPVIRRVVVGEKTDSISGWQMRDNHKGRVLYVVYILHDPSFEYMHMGYAAMIYFWADTGIAFEVMFGHGWGFFELDQPEKYKDEKRVMKYKKEPPREERYQYWKVIR